MGITTGPGGEELIVAGDVTPELASQESVNALLAQLEGPALCSSNAYLLAGHLPNAKLSIYSDANHGFLFQYPHEFAAEVNEFLAE